jgi:HupE / UreJ protein
MKKNKWLLLLLAMLIGEGQAIAHALPDSKAQLIVGKQQILIKFSTPLEILELASNRVINLQKKTSLDSLKQYYLQHIAVADTLRSRWEISVGNVVITETENVLVGKYPQVVAEIYLKPSNRNSLKEFTIQCDMVIHQIMNQSIIFSIEQDWQNGIVRDNEKQLGLISWDIPTGKIRPLKIRIEEGTLWKGFTNMIALGIRHIAEGTDHLLFLITLLLPSMLVAEGKRWTTFMGTKPSLLNLLKIVTAFTVGHSLTLLLGTVQWLRFPARPIEVLIAVSILISAFHALRPIFLKKEVFMAGGFGLIHGLAFAETLTNLHLSTKQLILSILGFNIGIELMQLAVIVIIVPFLIWLSRTRYYVPIRQVGAVVMMLFAIIWIFERL